MFSKKTITEGLLVSVSDYFLFASNFLIIFLINYFLGAQQVGYYSTSMAIAQIFYLTFGTPLALILRREIVVKPESVKKYINSFTSFKLLLFCAVSFVLLLFKYCFNNPLYTVVFVFFLIKGVEFLADSFLVYFQSLKKFKIYAILKIIYGIFSIAIISLLYFRIAIFIVYGLLFCLSIFYLFISVLFYWIENKSLLWDLDFMLLRYIKNKSWPLFLNAVLYQIASRGNIIILSIFLTAALIGEYTMGLTIVAALTAFVNSIALVLFPNLTTAYLENKQLFLKNIDKLLKFIFLIGIVITIVYNLSIGEINFYFLKWDENLIYLTRIMSLTIIPILLIGIIGNLFTIIYEQKQGLYASIVSVVITLSVNLLVGATKNMHFVGIGYFVCNFLSFFVFYIWLRILIQRQIVSA